MDANLTAEPIEWRLDDYLHFKKCGFITASPDEKCFGLNCIFCKTICLQFENFMQHIRDKHGRELCALYFVNDDVEKELSELIDVDDAVEGEEQRFEKIENKHNIIINEASDPPPPLPSLPSGHTGYIFGEGVEMHEEVQSVAYELAEMNSMQTEPIKMVTATDNAANNYIYQKSDMKSQELEEFLNFQSLPSIGSIEEDSSSQHSSSQDSSSTASTAPIVLKTTNHETEFKHCKEALNYILQAYKSNEVLWNRHHPDYRYNCKRKHYDEIAHRLYADLGYRMTGVDIGRELKKMRNMYRLDLMKMQTHNGLYMPKLWCFDQMEFIRKPMEMARTSTITPPTTTTTTVAALSEKEDRWEKESTAVTANARCLLSEDVMYRIIQEYRNHECLWYVEHPDFRSSMFRKAALKEAVNALNTDLNVNFTIEQLEKILKNLRRNFSLEKREHINAEKSQGTPLPHTFTFRYYTDLSFLESNVGPFRCTHCDTILNTSDQYKIHRSSHDGTSPFVCSICHKGFACPGNLTIHLRRHRGDYPFECKECGKRVATTSELTVHMRSHTGERPFVCELCGKNFSSWSFFNIHQRMHVKQPYFVCAVCQKGFYEKPKFVEHMNGHLNIRDKECEVCGKTFTCSNNLKTHMDLHSEIKKYECIICDRAFAQMPGLRAHMISLHSQVQTPNLRTSRRLVKYY